MSGDGTFFVASRQHPSVPMSEHSERFKDDWTAENCIAELQRIAVLVLQMDDVNKGGRDASRVRHLQEYRLQGVGIMRARTPSLALESVHQEAAELLRVVCEAGCGAW